MSRLLVVTAVAAERDAVLGDRSSAVGMVNGLEVHRSSTALGLVDVLAAGVGPVAAAVATCFALREVYDLVLSAGIAGGFAPLRPGDLAVANMVVHADLGAQDGADFAPMSELGWGAVQFPVDCPTAKAIAARCTATVGPILTVSTTTGSEQKAAALLAATPGAVAEGMEGVGVCLAAARAGIPFGELRAISNLVGPRNTGSWQIRTALSALTGAFDALFAAVLPGLAGGSAAGGSAR